MARKVYILFTYVFIIILIMAVIGIEFLYTGEKNQLYNENEYHVVINEFYIDQNKGMMWIELYNPTEKSIDISPMMFSTENEIMRIYYLLYIRPSLYPRHEYN